VDISGAVHNFGENISHLALGLAPGEADAVIAAHNAATKGKTPAGPIALMAPKTVAAHVAAARHAAAPAAANDDGPWGASDMAISAGLANLPVKSVKAITTAFGSLAQAIGHTGKLIQIIAPQLLTQSVALNGAAVASRSFTASVVAASGALNNLAVRQAVVPPAPANGMIQVTSHTHLDGRVLATTVSKHQAHALSGPRGSHLRPDGNYALRPVAAGY
jgi:hypothetical protein